MHYFYCFYADTTKSKLSGSLRGFQASAVLKKIGGKERKKK